MLFQVNMVLGLFNLIPIPPLDGSRVLGAFLPRNAYEKWAALDQYGMILVLAGRCSSCGVRSSRCWVGDQRPCRCVPDQLPDALGPRLSTAEAGDSR